jgi:prophage regulatory protein
MTILRMPAVKAETGHRSHASIYTAIKAGLFTKPVPIGQRSVGWPDAEVKAINQARIAGKTDAEIKVLVDKLHADRLVGA